MYIYIYVMYMYVLCIINPTSCATQANHLNKGFVAPLYTSSGRLQIVFQRFHRVLEGAPRVQWNA